MTVTYSHDRPLLHDIKVEEARPEPYVPVYARTRGSTRSRKGGVKTWMILAPVGALVLGGVAAAMIAGSGDDVATAPLAEPAATPPVLSAQPVVTETAPVTTAPAPVEATPAPAPAVNRTRAPVRRSAAPAGASTTAPAPAARVEPAAEPAGPQPYTATLNTAPAPDQTPVIVIQPTD
jgi:hypothetical protein